MLTFSPYHKHNFSSSLLTSRADFLKELFTALDGSWNNVGAFGCPVVICVWDELAALHYGHILATSSIDLRSVMSVRNQAGVQMYNGLQNVPLESHLSFYDDHPFSVPWEFQEQPAQLLNRTDDPMSPYIDGLTGPLNSDGEPLPFAPIAPQYEDASLLGLSLDTSEVVHVAWPARNAYMNMDYMSSCTPISGSFAANTTYAPHIISTLALTLFFIVSSFVFLQLRNTTSRDREVRFKNRLLMQLAVERESADQARDERTDFMAFLCHELRNPLHAVLSMSDSLQETRLDAEQNEAVFTIHASSELMLAITNDILVRDTQTQPCVLTQAVPALLLTRSCRRLCLCVRCV